MSIYSRRLIRTFCAVVENGGFSGAQQTLGLSQPAISTHIRDLETVLGYSLCQRGRSGFFLTERGKIAYEKCRQVLNVVDDFEADLLELRGSLRGTLRLGLVDTVLTCDQLPVSEAIRDFYTRDNEVQIELTVSSPTELEVDLLNNTIHIAIAPFWQKLEGLDYRHVMTEEHRMYCGRSHDLFEADGADIDPKILSNYPISSRTYQQQKEVHGIELGASQAMVSNMEAQMLLIRSGRFLGTLPVHFARDWEQRGSIRRIDHDDLVWRSDFFLAVRRTPTQRYAVSEFIRKFMSLVADSPAVAAG